jgi:TonB family protein
MLLVGGLCSMPAHADLYRALSDYKKGDYSQAFQEFLALAKLGQPLAQLNVAEMYHVGQGIDWSDIHAYAWATLAAANGEAGAGALADRIRPDLAPGSQRIAGWLSAPYTRAALERTLLPEISSAPAKARRKSSIDPMIDCRRKVLAMPRGTYPMRALRDRVQGTVIVQFTLMPDGRARFPRIIFAVPAGFFEDVAKESVLRGRFSRAAAGSLPVQCSVPFQFEFGPVGRPRSIEDYERQLGVSIKLGSKAKTGDPAAQQLYGLLLAAEPGAGKASWVAALRWLVKAAQGGMPVAQYAVGYDLLLGRGCRMDEAKALRWLRMAADQDQPNAEIMLATRLLRGTPDASHVARAKVWLERAAGQDTEDASQDAQLLLAAILAATPQPELRDPGRALALLSKSHDYFWDPTPPEIRAAAQAAEGHFAQAARSERTAISLARHLGWDLSPLKRRLSLYQSHEPWFGSLLKF